MEINSIIAENLKKLRQERNLSMGQLAELCDLSKVLLSQLERGDTNPTINTIWKIAKGLNVPYSMLLDQQKHNAHVVCKNDLPVQIDIDGHYRVYCYYENDPHRNFEFYRLELDSGYEQDSVCHNEKLQEYVYVQQGRLLLTAHGDSYELDVGDSVCFDASVEHTYRSIGDDTLIMVDLNFYPV